jgi:hypothetical protein
MEKLDLVINFAKEFIIDTNFEDINPDIFKIFHDFLGEVLETVFCDLKKK